MKIAKNTLFYQTRLNNEERDRERERERAVLGGDMKKYEIVYETVKREIVSGAYAYGDKLPSKRAIADEYGVSLSTAETALDVLRSEGYIDSRQRSGYFCSYSQDGAYAPFRSDKGEAVAPETDSADEADTTFPFYAYAKAVRGVLSDYGEKILLKAPNDGVPELKTALKNYLFRARGIAVTEKQIVLGAGAEYLYSLIPELLGRERIYAAEDPSYGQIERVYQAKGAKVRLLPLSADGIESEALKRTDAEILHVTPYRSYPTLVSAGATKKAEYLRFAAEKDGYVVEDDYLSEFAPYRRTTLFAADENGRVVYVNTFSKTISPALRVAYMLLPTRLCETYAEKLGFYSCPVPTTEQYALARILNDGSFERHVNKLRRALRK